ncbi:filamentous hemagglutinin family protein [Stenotrophomonas rhizophila]|uniref:filamentous haemagglutinin family protein n=1 Tax=Stenotrophomonas TaxID=40323 RepID=UPI003B7F1971
MVKQQSGSISQSSSERVPQLRPLSQAIAVLLMAGGVAAGVNAQQAFSPAWFANKGAQQQTAAQTGRLPNGMPSNLVRTDQQAQQARETLKTSLENLNTAAQVIAMQQRMQQTARDAARLRAGQVPDGLGEGGLKIDDDALTRGWFNASAPTQSSKDGTTTVSIAQTGDKAILNWETFNVGRNTVVDFDQQASWSLLNRVNDPNALPSQILGRIQGQGTVMLVNRNGVVFDGSSQVNVKNLAASAVNISDAQFRKGLYSDAQGNAFIPTFGNELTTTANSFAHGAATGDVVVERGAQITTAVPTSVTEGGGYVLLLGRQVHNQGQITTANGQTLLAAGDAFVIRKGMGTDQNQTSTTRGNVVTTLRKPVAADAAVGAASGVVSNSGLIQASTGDITLAGHDVRQQGALISTSSVHTRGTVHLQNERADTTGNVLLGQGSTTAIVLDDSATTALDVQRETLVRESDKVGDGIAHRRDQSLVQISTGGKVAFDDTSLTLASGGQIFVDAADSEVRQGARLDVAGYVGVKIAMEANNVQINVQGNEQRDAALNRDDKSLNSRNIWLDRRDLVLVPAGTNGYETDRWYTAGGLLEVGGYLGVTGHGIGEWSAQGGTVQFAGGNATTQRGSNINLSGGVLDVQTGYVNLTHLKGADGKLYSASTAPGDLLYSGLYRGFEVTHARWGNTEFYYNPLIAPQRKLENGYTVGRDAGRLILATRDAQLQGEVETTTFQGERQQRARDAALDGYQQGQTSVARQGQLVVGSYLPFYDKDSGQQRFGPAALAERVSIGADAASGATPGVIGLDAAWLNAQRFGGVEVYAHAGVNVEQALEVALGGTIALHASDVQIHADLRARGGAIALGDMVVQHTESGTPWLDLPISARPGDAQVHQVVIGEEVTLDARGVWTNQWQDPASIAGLPFVDGGSVALRSTGNVVLGKGSVIDASSGAAMSVDGDVVGGKGGSVTLAAGQNMGSGVLSLDGSLRAHGVKGGGALNIENGTLISIGGDLPDAVEYLAAGEASTLPVRLAADVTIQPGEIIPLSFSITITHVAGGKPVPVVVRPSVSSSKPVTLQAPWLLPTTVQLADNGPVRYAGDILPAGTTLWTIAELPAGYVLPAAVFPAGLAIPAQTSRYTAGTVASTAITVPGGTRLPVGTVWQRDVPVQSFLALDTGLFQSGFKQYNVVGRDGVTVVEGAQLAVAMPLLQVDLAAARAMATGADPDGALSVWLPPLQQDDAKSGEVTLRKGAGLALIAGTAQNAADLEMGRNSRISVDPGQTISLTGNAQITLDGTLQARGGRIAVLGGDLGEGTLLNRPNGMPNARSIWIGEQAVLDVSGVALTAVDEKGGRQGRVLDGGTLEIGARHDLASREIPAIDAFVVVREGARLDASGAQAVLDLPTVGQTTVASHGGVIALSASNGLFVDGSLHAAAGGSGARGGTLALNLETPVYGQVDRWSGKGAEVDDGVRVPRELVIEQQYRGSGLGTEAVAGEADPTLVYGKARYGVDAIQAGGFDTASLYVNGLLDFDGDVDLRMRQALYLTASSLGLGTDAARDSQVHLAAPYLRLGGAARRQIDNTIMPNPVTGSRNTGPAAGSQGVATVAEDASITFAGALVDLAGAVGFGARGEIVRNVVDPLLVERDAFGTVRIESQGDLRLREADLFSPGHTTLAAAQIYGSGNVTVGLRTSLTEWGALTTVLDPERVLDIQRIGTALPAQPYSVFGNMSFSAATVNQGGVLRAPLGTIVLGRADGNGYTGVVNLLPGSVTSVSANGLVMPYGGTVDGLVYNYNGVDVDYQGVGAEPKVEFRSHAVNAQSGAVLDLSGGGELTGAAFLSGRGGSTDARLNPLVQMGRDGFTLPGLSTNPVYAIVPGVQAGQAPIGAERGAGDPAIGQQITLGAGIPGLPAGTYTLLPSSYALLPGAFRVERNGLAGSAAAFGSTQAMRNGSWSISARQSVANTGSSDTLPTQWVVTAADTLRTYSQYNETSYANFALQQAAREGAPRPLLERDAKAINFMLTSPELAGSLELPALQFNGTVLDAPATAGTGSVARLLNATNYEILADGTAATEDFAGISVHAGELNRVGAARLEIGGRLRSTYANPTTGSLQSANVINIEGGGSSNSIVMRAGAQLQAAEVFLMTGRQAGGITLEQGAGINTLGQGAAAYDATQGYIYTPGRNGLLAVSNGQINLLAPEAPDTQGNGAGTIEIGACTVLSGCTGTTRLYSEGTIATATDNRFVLGDAVRYGTRNLSLAVGGINVGSAEAIAEATARGTLPAGMTLNQDVLSRLLLGDTSVGAPALEALSLTARESVNFYGDVSLSTYDAITGKSALQQLVLGTPAIHGHGDANAVARIHTDTLIWSGALAPAGSIVADGPGTGHGQLVVDARDIVFGFGPRTQPDTVRAQDRLALGFASVHLNASRQISANHKGSLSIFETQGAWNADTNGYARAGGELFISTPLLTGAAGSVNTITAGGNLHVTGNDSAARPDDAALAAALGAEIALDSRSGNLLLDTAVLLPSGKLSLAAQGDVRLADGAQLDLAGRRIAFFDTAKYSWGGDVVIDSRSGGVQQAAGARIDLAAQNNRAGKLSVRAADGVIDLAGQLLGGASGHYDAGGTEVPYSAGRIDLHGQRIADFSGLNTRLSRDGVTGARSFRIGQGDLVLGDEVAAREVNIALDSGQLTVNGSINASGEQAGSIRLSARNGVTLGSTAVLDASAEVLRRDSYGVAIDAPNRATIEIDSGSGTLAIASGARLDLRVAGGRQEFGTVALNAPRVGGDDVAVDAGGAIRIEGARTIQLNAFITDTGAAVGTETSTSGESYQVIDQAYLDRLHAQSSAFIDAALGNRALVDDRLAGLRRYDEAFHLRPGVEVVADLAVNADGNLHVDGDLDLSAYRYASLDPNRQRSAVRGSGEAGALVLRAQGDLEVFGSISDGFDGSRLGATFDDNGWYLTAGRQLFGSDVVVPHAGLVTLAAGTVFNAGKVLNYALPIGDMQMAAGTLLPVDARLALPLALAKGTVLGAAVHDASGALLYAAGTVLADAVTLPQGARLSAGLRLPLPARIAAMTWPAGVALPASPLGNLVTLAADLALAKGAFIPSDTEVVLPGGATTVNLRPTDADGNQGRLWALAPMLAAGSQSWDISLVAGADVAAADRLTVAPAGTGSLRLSDPHYGQGGAVVEIPGTGSPATYRWGDVDAFERMVVEYYGEYILSFVPTTGTGFTEDQLNELTMWGFVYSGPENLNDLGYDGVAAIDSPATPPETEFKTLPGREQLPSVVRTGTGDLRLVSGKDIATTSLYGVYTAGTASAALTGSNGDPYHQPRARVAPSNSNPLGNSVLGDAGEVFEHLVDGGSQSLYQAWYPEAGGNLLLRAGGNILGDSLGRQGVLTRTETLGIATPRLSTSAAVGNWLWRQGTGSVQAGAEGLPTAWWINFGTYVAAPDNENYNNNFVNMPQLVGFTGFGTLGGGNLLLEAGGDAGMLQRRGDHGAAFITRSAGLNLTVASTGRVGADGVLVQTGGGDLDIRIGGGLNADPALRSFTGSNAPPVANEITVNDAQRLDINGSFTNLRGALRLEAGAVGGVELRYGKRQDAKESRPYDVYTATAATAAGGPVLVLGDAGARLDARGDLVLGTVVDPGRVAQFNNGTPFSAGGNAYQDGGWSWFSLWTPSTAVDLMAAGGNLTPSLAMQDRNAGTDAQATDGNIVYPSVLRAAAASGSIYYGRARVAQTAGTNNEDFVAGVVLAPSPVDAHFNAQGTGQLELLAAGSIYANGTGFATSGADPTALPNPWNPGFVGQGQEIWYGRQYLHNVSAGALAPSVLLSGNRANGSLQIYPLFSFTAPTASGYVHVGQTPSRYYALNGDLVGLRTGGIVDTNYSVFNNGVVTTTTNTWYDGGGAVAIRAGRDIVNSGTPLGAYDNMATTFGNLDGALGWMGAINRGDPAAEPRPTAITQGTARGNLIVHTSADDVSIMQAGRDIRFSTFYVAGPGLLDISAGRDVYMADKGELRSLGPVASVTPGDRGSGASIAVAAGLGRHGADWNAFAARYLDAANLADPNRALAEQDGKVVRVYGDALSLTQWLQTQFGYGGDEAGAAAFLAQQQQALDQGHAAAVASGGTASNRDLAREFKQESQLHLVNWLTGRFGGANGRGLHFDAASMDAQAFFAALPAEQQSAFLRNVYYAELKAAGREYTAVDGPREGSYLRGREAIATLLPTKDAKGGEIAYQGDLTMFSSALYYEGVLEAAATRRPKPGRTYLSEAEWIAAGRPTTGVRYYRVNDAGIHTDFGGDIHLLVPGGRTLVGVDGGFLPGAGSGVLTQGEGDINIYSRGSLLLGQSRIFTTFGGNILAWSAEGDINAGRGSKTTVVYTSQRRVYDTVGNVALSPNTPNTGAGIATLNPIAEVPPGDIDLIAPLGTIDAGEAGIRVSGNVNLAALQVLNADNIQVQGKAVGIPVVAAVNVSALTSASAAANTAVQAAQEMVKRQTQQTRPSTISVQVLGFGSDTSSVAPPKHDERYDPDSVVQVIGMGELSTGQRARLDAATTKRQ